MLQQRDIPVDDALALGTIDSWLVWNLTGGEAFVTDDTNASRTMLYDIGERQWSQNLCDLLHVPMSALPEVRPSSGRFGVTTDRCGAPAGIPISGIAGDRQAALFGQACFEPGMAKNTYGTGSFVLMNVGSACPPPTEGMLSTIAWELSDGTIAYALEGAIFVTGATIQWLRDGINIIDDASETGPLAASVDDSGGVVAVPAFAGLGSPWWDPYARAPSSASRAEPPHTSRVPSSIDGVPIRDAVDADGRGLWHTDRRSAGRWWRLGDGSPLQMQADQLGVTVRRPVDQETTALGAAFLAGLAEDVADLDSIAATWLDAAAFDPTPIVRWPTSVTANGCGRSTDRAIGSSTADRPDSVGIRSRRLRSYRRFRRAQSRSGLGQEGVDEAAEHRHTGSARVRAQAGPIGRR